MRRCSVVLLAVLAGIGCLLAPPASAGETPIGRMGDTLRVEYKGFVADVTLNGLAPSPIPPGFGYPPRPPRQQVWRAQITVHTIAAPNPYGMAKAFSFRGVTPTGDAYQARNNDSPDAMQRILLNAPAGATVAGGIYWDCYRDLVSNVVLLDENSGYHIAQWNL